MKIDELVAEFVKYCEGQGPTMTADQRRILADTLTRQTEGYASLNGRRLPDA